MSECCDFFNIRCCSGESCEDCSNVGPWLHGDDSQLIFFVDPHKESLIVVVEDTSSFGPVSVQATGIQESVAFFKEEVVSDKLSLLLLGHRSKGVEGTSELTLE